MCRKVIMKKSYYDNDSYSYLRVLSQRSISPFLAAQNMLLSLYGLSHAFGMIYCKKATFLHTPGFKTQHTPYNPKS